MASCSASTQPIRVHMPKNQSQTKITELLWLKFYLAVGTQFISNNRDLQISSYPIRNLLNSQHSACITTNITTETIFCTLRKIFSECCVAPCRPKNVLLTTCGPIKPICKIRKKNQEPLDLLATLGQSCVCVNVCVLVSVCVWVCVIVNDVVTWVSRSLRSLYTLSSDIYRTISLN